MDTNTWNKLTETEKKEIKVMSSEFIRQVQKSSSINGFDFLEKYEIRKMGDLHYIFEKESNLKFGNFSSKNKKVIELLIADVVQNYGR